MAQEREEDHQLDIVITLKKFLVEEVCFNCTERHRIEEDGEPGLFILSILLDDHDPMLSPSTLIFNNRIA